MMPGGILMEMTIRRFLPERRGRLCRVIVVLFLSALIGLPCWIGDENPLIVFPLFLTAITLGYTGPWYARLIVGAIFYTLLLPPNMIIDSVLMQHLQDTTLIVIKNSVWILIWFVVWRFVPKVQLMRSAKLWMLLGSLSLAPLFAVLSFTIWNARWFAGNTYYTVAFRISYTVLPFAVLSALALLAAIVVLSRHEELEQQQRLAEIQSVYYQGLQREQIEVRTLRHDLRNHITVAKSLLEQQDVAGAMRYLEMLCCSDVLTGRARICENDIANAVLSSKVAMMECEDIQADWGISLPKHLSISDIELCALIGNALDNAIEAVRHAQDKRIIVRARADKGVLMLRVENAIGKHPRLEQDVFKTTKDDRSAHGFGLNGMQVIAQRHGGSLEATVKGGRFELVVCVPMQDA